MREQVIDWLKKNVPSSRLTHILGVESFATELANHHGINPHKAAQAGLMHDLAKFFSPQRLLTMAQAEGLILDEVLERHPHLIHADISAIVARDQFGVTDEEILDAIRHHTLGYPDMPDLSCIVFIADAIEPNRGNTSELEKMRQVSRENLYQALLLTCDYSIQHLLRRQQILHPRTVLTRNWALQQMNLRSQKMREKTTLAA